jgi:uncharacterized protein YbbK (DUF523 family)
MYIASACLLGVNCKYDGQNNFNEKLYEMFKKSLLFPVCPEVLGGMTIPRSPCEIKVVNNESYVFDIKGNNKTKEFKLGANKVLDIAKLLNIDGAILMDRSPSCGVNKIYDGNFNHNLIDGIGITTKILKDNGYSVYTIKELNNLSFNN